MLVTLRCPNLDPRMLSHLASTVPTKLAAEFQYRKELSGRNWFHHDVSLELVPS